MTKWEHRQGWTAWSGWEIWNFLCVEVSSLLVSVMKAETTSAGRSFPSQEPSVLLRGWAGSIHRCGVRRMGAVFLLLCYSVCFTFSWCCPLGQNVFSFSLGIDLWNLTQEHLQQRSRLAAQLVVTLGTAFLCRGRAGELLQAFVVFSVWKMLEQTRTWPCWFNQSPPTLLEEECYLFLLFSLMCWTICHCSILLIFCSFYLYFSPFFFFFQIASW